MNVDSPDSYRDLFVRATRNPSVFPYQERFATATELPALLRAPTGAGKTAAVVLGWLWRLLVAARPTPRRLVYCLPMRTLVEQTRDEVRRWLGNLGWSERVAVHVLMGGEDADDWDLEPERPAILIGTQDMLLSRALNRGYGMSRFRWPMHYALLNNDSLWVLDEIQLMGTGLATSSQLQAFRESLGVFGTAKTLWMSATLRPEWLHTIDFRERAAGFVPHALEADDYVAKDLCDRWQAAKPIAPADVSHDEANALAAFVAAKHQAGSLTLVIVNTVERSRKLFEALRKRLRAATPKMSRAKGATATPPTPPPDLQLIHSRFRPPERRRWSDWLRQSPESLQQALPGGRIVVATQVVEAGVDLSARTLITELAPWASLVQRFGRCNRRGEFESDEPAQVFWIDVPARKAGPYGKAELASARERLRTITDVGLKPLQELFDSLTEEARAELFPFDPAHVVRRKDFVDLFDTTPDLAGNDVDVARFIRDGDDLDVQVFWRDGEPPWEKVSKSAARRSHPRRDELCAVPFVRFRDDFLKKKGQAFRWDALDGRWIKGTADAVYPGQVYWIPAAEGGYDAESGWDPAVKARVTPVPPEPDVEKSPSDEDAAYDGDSPSQTRGEWQTIAVHTQQVFDETAELIAPSPLDDDTKRDLEEASFPISWKTWEDLKPLPIDENAKRVLQVAARWHDWGKAHAVFQGAIVNRSPADATTLFAKAPRNCWSRYERKHFRLELASALGLRAAASDSRIPLKHFRHELASALGVLALLKSSDAPPSWSDLANHLQDLALYLIAAHHGKVRLSIRSLPEETMPPHPDRMFARGVWDGDVLPAVDLGGGVAAPAAVLDLSPMRLGRGADGRPSWTERMLGLRGRPDLGPLKLAYLEAVLRAADMRASRAADEGTEEVRP